MDQIDKGISDIAGALTDPIIVFPGGWGEDIPGWLKDVITLERLAMNVCALRGEEMTGTDAEACAYLYTVSLTRPLSHDWSQIYLYVATQTYRKWGKGEPPAGIVVDSLTDNQMEELERLKRWIYRQRTKARPERDKQEETVSSRANQQLPLLFDF
jgi:hypothetical protein